MVKRGYTQGGFNKSRVLSSGRVLKYNKASPVAGSSRAFRKFAKRGGNPYGLQRAVRMSKELGYVDVAVANYALNTSGQCVHLNVVPQGTTGVGARWSCAHWLLVSRTLGTNSERFEGTFKI